MQRDRTRWLDPAGRSRVFVETERSDRPFYFGFQPVEPGEKSLRVRRHFDAVAHCYDLMNTVLSFGIHHLWKKTAVRMMHLHPGHRVLDVCGGTGDLSVLAARAVGPAGQVVLYDLNWNMIAAGRSNLAARAPLGTVRPVQGDAESISFPDRCFDAAMVGFGIRNVIRMENGIREMHRVLRPGGVFMCLEFSKPLNPVFRWVYDMYSLYVMPLAGQLMVGLGQAYAHLPESIRMFATPQEMTVVLERSGFKDIRHRRLTNGIATVYLARKPKVP